MAKLRIAQVGCGGMGLRHMRGQIELRQLGFDTFEMVALCDIHASAAEHLAKEAERDLGKRPRVYTDLDELLESERPDAVDIVTDARSHHTVALKAFEAGVHVAVEKPLSLTVRAGLRMIEGARRAGKVLSVSENYRRDPMNRLVKAILDGQALGDPRLVLNVATSGTREVPHSTAWRHLKLLGGYLLDYAVHNADLLLYFMGEVDRVYAETALWERVRYATKTPLSSHMAQFYRHRVREDIERGETIECTSEDMVSAVIRFKSGAIGQFAMTIAAPGQPNHLNTIHCGEGSIGLPGSRSGGPVSVTRSGEGATLGHGDVMGLAPQFELDGLTARFFEGRRRISSYDLSFEEIDRKLIAIELQDFANAVLDGSEPEVTGQAGLDAVALTYAFLESGQAGQAVSFEDVAADRVNAYQEEINEGAGLGAGG